MKARASASAALHEQIVRLEAKNEKNGAGSTIPLRGDLAAPQADLGDARPDAAVDERGHVPLGRGGLVQAQSRRHVETSKKARIRATARSGSGSSPAASARVNSATRCGTDRVLSRPPTIRKCDW